MSNTPLEIQNCLLELEKEAMTSGSFTHKGQTYPCVITSKAKTKTLGIGGWAPDHDITLLVRFGVMKPDPSLKDLIQFQGRTYNIDQIITPTGNPFLKLECNDPARGT